MNEVFAEQSLPAYSRVVLFRGPTQYTVQDVLAAAWFLGELEAPWRELLTAIACEESASELDLEADEETLTSMSEEFRYERELLTVEEMERWLAARDLSEDDFSDYLVRRHWRENPPAPVTVEDSKFIEGSPELWERLRVDLLFSGKFDRLVRALSWRLAGMTEEGNTSPELLNEERERFFERTGLNETSLAETAKTLNPRRGWLEECLQMEACYRHTCDTLLTDEARARAFAVMRLPLTRIKIETLTLRSKNAAQEAALCLRENRLSPDEMAKECGISWERQELFLADCEATLQQDFLSAAPGEILGPKPYNEAFLISRIQAKKEPALTDKEIRARIDRRLLESHFADLSSKNIRCVLGEGQRE